MKPSKAAIEAAKEARRKGYIQDHDEAEQDMAKLIDEAVKPMREALEKTTDFLSTWVDALSGVQMTEAEFKATSGFKEGLAALRDFTPEEAPDDPR